MKNKLLSGILAIIFVLTCCISAFSEANTDISRLGDVNNDGKITASDARLLLRTAARLDAETEDILTYGDIDSNGKITASDARTVLRIAAKLENVNCIVNGHDYETISEERVTTDSFCGIKIVKKCKNCDNIITDYVSADETPQTDEQWLDFFNYAVNKLKSEVPEMTKSKQTKTADIQLSNPLGNAYISAIKNIYRSDEVVEILIANGDKDSAQANISPDGASYVSTLTMADIKSINHTVDGNGNFVIKIAMNDTSNPDKQSSYAKVFRFILVDDVMHTYAPDIGATVDRSNVELKYTNCYATATITPDGKVVSYETMVNTNIFLRDAQIKIITTDIDVSLSIVTKYYNIKW